VRPAQTESKPSFRKVFASILDPIQTHPLWRIATDRRVLRLAGAAFLLAYFLLMNWGGLRVHFALDDLANIRHYYFHTSAWDLLAAQFSIWRGDYRPMGGLFYIAIYHFAGLNPVPYQAFLLALLLATVYLVYRFAGLLGSGEGAAYLAALIVCYHAGLANLYYNAAFIYDVLCCFFYVGALICYLRIRNRGRLLNTIEKITFLLLFLCALNSKEMAVTLPVALLTYECIYHPPGDWNLKGAVAWLLGPAQMVVLAGILDAVDVLSKISGPNALAAADGYRPVFTLARIYDCQKNLIQDLSLSWSWEPGWGVILGIWALLALVAWWSRRPILRFLFWFLLAAPLPIEFIPGKRHACFALILVAWAIFVGVTITAAAGRLTRNSILNAIFPRSLLQGAAVVMVLAAAFFWLQEQRRYLAFVQSSQMWSLGDETWDLIQQFPKFPRPRAGSRVAFLASPLSGNDMWSLALLWIHDRSVDVHVWTQGPLSAEDLAKTDYIYTFHDRTLIRLK
jgi:hypothetical protein